MPLLSKTGQKHSQRCIEEKALSSAGQNHYHIVAII